MDGISSTVLPTGARLVDDPYRSHLNLVAIVQHDATCNPSFKDTRPILAPQVFERSAVIGNENPRMTT